jgi:hypothetical protein
MKNIYKTLILIGWCLVLALVLPAQSAPECNSNGAQSTTIISEVNFNYGSLTNAKNTKNRTSMTIGQIVVGEVFEPSDNGKEGAFGFWSGFILPPQAPMVTATQGDLLDRIQVSWKNNVLGAAANQGWRIRRNGVYLADVASSITNYNDFNVIAGVPYNYEVTGLNQYGEGPSGKALGFQVPNGTVTGWVQTLNGNPVPNALVTLMPMQGFSAKFGPLDGAFTDTTGSKLPSMLPVSNDPWTITFWIKTNAGSTANAGIMQFQPFPFNIRNTPSGQEGIAVDLGGAPLCTANFPTATKNAWHHVALNYDGSLRLYIDGVLSALAPTGAIPSAIDLKLGALTGSSGWAGLLDELRIYHRYLDEIEIAEVMEGTASSFTQGLKFYWKMDEEKGLKSFDVIQRTKLYFCGAAFDSDRPAVRTAAITNNEGYYRIESANYGTGTTFLAEPMKNFYLHRALKFVRANADYATLPDFALPPKATLETWVNSAGPAGEQCLLSKVWPGNNFRLLLKPNGTDNDVFFYLNGQEHNFGQLGMGYQHLAFTIDSSGNDRMVTAYKNGIPFGAASTFAGVTGNWSDSTRNWIVGARSSGNAQAGFFGGLIDEIAVYDTTLTQARILEHFQNSRSVQEHGLRVYFAFDEGSGNRLNHAGSLLLPSGTVSGADWITFSPNQMTSPHVFTPKTRQVTLNPSVTSVDQVDFTDRSTIGVSGYVRYQNSDCFAKNIEILVNGASFSPPIFTDSTGRFVADFEPGTTATLSPKYEDHAFVPSSWNVTNVSSPISGILFNDTKTRRITGQIAGGNCKKSIITGIAENCRIKVRSKNGCYEKEMQITATDGQYEFNNLPPVEVTISIINHNNPVINQALQSLGGRVINLAKQDSLGVDFIYVAPPQLEVTGFDPYIKTACPDQPIVLHQLLLVTLDIKAYGQYGAIQDTAGRCYLDTATLSISNSFDLAFDVSTPLIKGISGGVCKYKFVVNNPNEFAPYTRIIEITADDQGKKSAPYTNFAIIEGTIIGEAKFTTALPMVPTCVLHDPPGDGSYAFLEKDSKVCNTIEIESSGGLGPYFANEITLGVDLQLSFGIAAGVEATINFGALGTLGAYAEGEAIFSWGNQKSMEYCTTFNERVSTDDGDLIVGGATALSVPSDLSQIDTLPGNDVYIGTGFNFIFSDSKRVSFNDTNCAVNLDNVVTGALDRNKITYYKYSEWNIENNVIRYLDTLYQNGIQQDSVLKSIKSWKSYIKMNQESKKKAKVEKNISFDAGVQYESFMTLDSSTTTGTTSSQEEAGALSGILDVGLVTPVVVLEHLEVGIKWYANSSQHYENTTEKSLTTGYVLKDDDPGDTWSVDVKRDPMYGTPVFNIIAGQSSCPWELGTAHREAVALIPKDGTQRTNVPSNEAAVFHFDLGNRSSTFEDRVYTLNAEPDNNPDGAVIKLNGAVLDHSISYPVAYGQTVPITLTVERGPQVYSYHGLKLSFSSECHTDRANTLGKQPDSETYLFAASYLDVDFLKPCSEVEVSSPQQGWVIKKDALNPASQDILSIAISGYDLTNADLVGILLQYRPEHGDGAWINITPSLLPKSTLGPVFTPFQWNTAGNTALPDGPYEIRAVSVCTGGGDLNGYSHIIKGRIDREPPSLVGTPQPSDGVFNVGDEISFTFNKHINCDKLIPADLTQPNNVALYDVTTNQLIATDVTCFENKIILKPNFQNEFFENHILRAELHDIQDLTGNKLNFTQWEFYVDRNELAWLSDSLGMTKFEDQTKTGVANIHNRGGYPVSFTIQGVPDWVHVVPNQGTLAPNEIRPISFTVDSSLAFGLWSDSITLRTETGQNPFFMGGDEGLPLGVRVVCRPPDWDLNANLFENSENMVLELNIEGKVSTDVEDMVVAYIGDTLCGRAHLQYVPAVHKYLAYLTIYGNPNHILQPIRLEAWDASACLRYAVVEDYFLFQPDDIIGDISAPQVVHTSGNVLRDVPLGFGWNWLSFNLNFPNPGINSALASLRHPESDLMKGQNAFSTYLNGGGWFGSLNNLGNTSMYIYRADQADTLKMLGTVLDPAVYPIPVTSGWNWIGYIPNYSLPVNEALSSLTGNGGDVIKSQQAFAQYFNATYGWIGNLKFMQPPQGYQIKLTTPGTLIYPPAPSHFGGNDPNDTVQSRGPKTGNAPENFWTVDPTQFENSMTLIGMLQRSDTNATTASMELGAFVGNELRGSGQAIYIPPFDSYLFFLTVYANASGEQVAYKLFDNSAGNIQALHERMYFSPDLHQGSIENPLPFTLMSSGAQEANVVQSFEVQPNPFQTETMFRFALPHTQEVRITVTDMSGKPVANLRTQAREGLNTLVWRGQSDAGTLLSRGVYFVRLQTESGSIVRKVVLQ